MKYIYKKRPFSYDLDWLEAFKQCGVECVEESKELELDDVTIVSHSILGDDTLLMDFMIKKFLNRRGKLIFFLGNEWKWFEDKRALVKALGADLCATQLRLDDAKRLYGDLPLIEIPHGMGDYHRPRTPRKYRAFDIGVRGMKYPVEKIGDSERGVVCSESTWPGWRTDFLYGFMLKRADWGRALNDWLAMPSTEAGIVGAKACSSRHFDAIGAHTNLVMYEGEFNGVLKPHEHYIVLNRDHSNLKEVRERVEGGDALAKRAFEHCMDSHRVIHRVRHLLNNL